MAPSAAFAAIAAALLVLATGEAAWAQVPGDGGAFAAPAPVPAAPAPPPAGGAAPGPSNPARALTPAEREALRQLGEEQRQALGRRDGRARGPGAWRLSPKERRELREQLREEHERFRRRG